MTTVRLTSRTVESMKPTPGRRAEYFDATLPGLCFRVTAAGHKSFCLFYRHAGRLRRLTLGSFPPLSLATARELAKAALAEAARGGDPASRKQQEKQLESFAELADEYLERHAKKQKRTWRGDERTINTELLPAWRHVKARDITRRDVRVVLDRIVDRGSEIQANRVRALISKMYNWGIGRDLVDHNPCQGLPRPGKERRRDRVLSEDEIRKFWATLDDERPLIAAHFKIRLLTAQRGGETLRMRRQDVDVQTAWWTIPGEISKNGLPHRVPLSPMACECLEEIWHMSPQSPWVFPGPRGEHMTSLQKAIERIRERAGVEFRGHDLRRTAASHMTSMGISRLVVAKILNHAENSVTAVYDRHSYDAEKRDALNEWSRKLAVIIGGTESNVLPFRG